MNTVPSGLARFVLDNSLLLLAGTGAAVVWANLDFRSYDRVAHPLHFVVNDIGMVFFFALAAKEVFEATLPGGALASPRRALSPLAAAVGGMVLPALIYLGLTWARGPADLARGWAIPCATDIAFSAMVARIVPARDQVSAIGLQSVSFNVPQVLGPAAGGVLITRVGVSGALVAATLTSAAVILALVLMAPIPARPRERKGSMLGDVRDGIVFVLGDPVIRSVVAITVAVAMAGAVTLLPAFLGLAGHRIDRWKIGRRVRTGESNQAAHHTLSGRWADHVGRHPWRYAIGSFVVLVAIAAPVLDMRTGLADDGDGR